MARAREVPVDYEKIAEMIDEANNPESRERLAFKTAADHVDEIIENLFGLNTTEEKYVHARLSDHTLRSLEPRYTWTVGAHHQRTRTYRQKARFA